MADIDLGYLGKYRVIDEIGRGGFSIVYRAEHPRLKKTVALKLMLPAMFNDPELIQRFIQEARTVAALRHENITQVLDLAEDQGRLFMVMEYLPGGDLRHWLKQNGRCSFHQAARILNEVAAALDYAHSQGIVHGDVKPGNILLAEDGSAKLADFGVLRAVETSGATSADMTRGTPYYISPEQAEGGRPTPRSDQYALGVVAYELFTGKIPFDGDSPLTIYLKHMREAAPSASQINTLITPQLDAILRQALEKEPSKRFGDCCLFIRALKEAVAATEAEQYQDLVSRAGEALAGHDPETARPLIESALQIMPDESRARALFNDLQARERAQRSYQAASAALDTARAGVLALQVAKASLPDPNGILARLAPAPAWKAGVLHAWSGLRKALAPPPAWKALLQRWLPGLLLALLLGFVGLLLGLGEVGYTRMSPAGALRQATLVAQVRTSTPTVTLTPTPTSTPTSTSTPTLTPTPTPTYTSTATSTPTPVLLSFSGDRWNLITGCRNSSSPCWHPDNQDSAEFTFTSTNSFYVDDTKLPILGFWQMFQIESCCDSGNVEISIDNGDNWDTLVRLTGQNDWQFTMISLKPYTKKEILIRFRFTSDSSWTYDGWFIQDVQIFWQNPIPFPTSTTSGQATILPTFWPTRTLVSTPTVQQTIIP